ncbi:L,D-transpeptidase [Pseudochrobactrum saccharolyticum]|uniref:L,D-transpeptidase n=1 Tax=Pseudochrobactrum saccharolyticum TaxID=354352 RepID=UPI0027954A7A|nr:L,D-transpeptidase [Pseudochrobactrum saccharolyticum]
MSLSPLKLSLLFACAAALSACTTVQNPPSVLNASVTQPQPVKPEPVSEPAATPETDSAAHMYRAMTDQNYQIPAIDLAKLKPEHRRTVVDYKTTEKPGTIIVDQPARYLYFVLPEGKAVRYAVGVGPAARGFNGGDAIIAHKAAWPRWTPTQNMIKRNPNQYLRYKDGVDGGPGNPMGARALYMHKDGIDTYYRVHGTNKPSSIGKGVSAGCIRLINQDIIDLHSRVKPGARIVVK